MDRRLLTITELARRSGISSRTIRFWSDAGLIPVARRSAARYDLRVERYWQLLAALHGRPAHPSSAAACAWFGAALRAAEAA